VYTECARIWNPIHTDAAVAARAGLRRILHLSIVGADPNSANSCLASRGRAEQILVGGETGETWLVSLDGRQTRRFDSSGSGGGHLALGTDLAAAGGGTTIRVWDLETGESRDLEMETRVNALWITPQRGVMIWGPGGLQIWDWADGTFEILSKESRSGWLSRDGRLLLVPGQGENGEAVLHDLEQDTTLQLDAHGPVVDGMLAGGGQIAVTWRGSGFLQIGPVSGGPVHLLASHEAASASGYVVSPAGDWIATWMEGSGTISLWPVPDLSQPPLHTLPLDELLTKLRALTNLRVVPDPESDTGWGWSYDPFPGWEEVPTW